MELRVIEPHALPLDRAIQQSAGLLAAASRDDASYCGAIVLSRGPAIVLGRMQHAGRVLSGLMEIPVVRRATSGTAASIDGGLLLSLALPSADALFRDTALRTTLNRNVRPFLWGLAAAGVRASYFGREWIAWRHRPVALLGFDVASDGAVLIEAWMSARGNLALPREVTTDLEASTDRLRARVPVSLEQILGERDLHDVGREIMRGAVERLGAEPVPWIPVEPTCDLDVEVRDLDSPLPAGSSAHPPIAVPIGWIDAAVGPHGSWVGGDMLGPTHALGSNTERTLTRGLHRTLPIEGSQWEDIQRAHDALGPPR